jgi:hypothetical protein
MNIPTETAIKRLWRLQIPTSPDDANPKTPAGPPGAMKVEYTYNEPTTTMTSAVR